MLKKKMLIILIFILGLFVMSKVAGATDFKSVLGEPYKIAPGATLPKAPTKVSPSGYETEDNYIKDEVIVKFKPEIGVSSAQANSIITSLGGAKTKRVDKSAKFTVVKLPKNISAKKAVKFYESLPNVEYAELNHIVKAAWSPNDPFYQYQWHFNAISLSQAWDYDATPPLYGGDPSIVVAVLDTGIAYENYDIYSKAPDFTGSYPAFTQGYNFINNHAHANDDNGHGTHVASTIAQSTDNSVSGAGVAFNSTIMPIKVLNAQGFGSDDAIASGITYAKNHGAHILNMSLDSTSYSQTIADAVADAVSAGKVLIAAAGNGGNDGVGDPECDYPGRYDGVICVGATRYHNNGRASYSNYGTGLDIVAPGGQVDEGYFNGFYGWGLGTYATLSDCVTAVGTNYGIIDSNLCAGDGIVQQSFTSFFEPDYYTGYTQFTTWPINGTSQATPHVSGAAALLMAYGIPASSIEEVLTRSATDLGAAGYDTDYGWGLLNAAAAFSYPTISSVSPNSGSNDEETSITISGSNFSSSNLSGAIGSTALKNVSYVNATTITAIVPSHLGAGTYNISITTGGKTATLENGFTIIDPAPASPSKFRAVSGNKKIKLAWSKPDIWDFAGIKVLRKKGNYPANQNDGKLVYQGKKTSKTDRNLTNGARYYYSAFAYDNGGNYSQAAQVTASPGKTFLFDSANTSQYGNEYRSGANITKGDLDGKGGEEIILGTKEGQIPKIKILNYKGKEKRSFYPFGKSYRCGVNVAAGDLNGDGKNEIVAGLGFGCASRVKIFNKKGKAIMKKSGFKAYPGKTGVKVATGDLDGDNKDEVITAPGKGTKSKIYIYGYSGKKIKKVLNTKGFLAFSKSMKSGVQIYAGDLNFDNSAEIIAVPQKDDYAYVKVFNYNGKKRFKKPGFYPFGKGYKNETVINVGDINYDGYQEIVAAKKDGTSADIYSYKHRKTTPRKIGWQKIEKESVFVVIRGK